MSLDNAERPEQVQLSSSQADPIWVTGSTGGSSNVNITGSITLPVTSSVASPVWVTGSTGGSPNVNITGSITLPVQIAVNGVVDASNSTSATLTASEAFTGSTVSILPYAGVSIFINSDQSSAAAPNGLIVEFSTDGTNWGDAYNSVFTAPNIGQSYIIPATSQFYRVRYLNGATPQSFFRLQSILRNFQFPGDTIDMDNAIQETNHALVTMGAIVGQTGSGGPFTMASVNPSGALLITGSQANPVWVSGAVTAAPIGTQSVAGLVGVSGTVAVTSGTISTVTNPVTVTSTIANPVNITGTVLTELSTVIISGSILVSSSVGSPVYVTGALTVSQSNTPAGTQSVAGLVGVSGTVAVISGTITGITNTVGVSGTVAITSGTITGITNTIGVSGTVAVTSGTITGITNTVAVTSTQANPVWVTQSGGTSIITVSNTASVTSTQADPVWVTQSGGTSVVAVSNTASVTSTQANPVWVTGVLAQSVVLSGTFNAVFSGTQIVTASLTAAVPVQLVAGTDGGMSAHSLYAVSGTNATIVKDNPGQVFGWSAANVATAFRFLKLYNTASSPTTASAPFLTIGVPPSGSVSTDFANGIVFSLGICYLTTQFMTGSDSTGMVAGDMVVNILYK